MKIIILNLPAWLTAQLDQLVTERFFPSRREAASAMFRVPVSWIVEAKKLKEE